MAESPEVRERRLARMRDYSATPERVAARKAYALLPSSKAKRKAYARSPKGKETQLRANLQRKYGITLERYREMVVGQAGKCAICGDPPTGLGKQNKHLNVDHCHITGKIRAALCCNCNRALGMMKEEPERLRAAAKYLEKHSD